MIIFGANKKENLLFFAVKQFINQNMKNSDQAANLTGSDSCPHFIGRVEHIFRFSFQQKERERERKENSHNNHTPRDDCKPLPLIFYTNDNKTYQKYNDEVPHIYVYSSHILRCHILVSKLKTKVKRINFFSYIFILLWFLSLFSVQPLKSLLFWIPIRCDTVFWYAQVWCWLLKSLNLWRAKQKYIFKP